MHQNNRTQRYVHKADLEVVSPLRDAIALRDLRLEHGHVGHGCGQTGDGLPPAASHSH